jgi:S-adenosylmethionine-dependent methyltransferase
VSIESNYFNKSVEDWIALQQTPRGRLKYAITQANLRRYLPEGPLSLLDAGGGNGRDSMWLASEGHSVTIVDYSTEMLEDARVNADRAGARAKVSLHLADLSQIPALFPLACFDVILCHNVLQYSDDLESLLSYVISPLKSGGIVSILSVNRYAIPYRVAFKSGSLDKARNSLEQHIELATTFGVNITEYVAEEIIAKLSQMDCVVEQHYGIRCIFDYWGNDDLKSNAETLDEMEKLELALSDRHPYKHLARFFQVVARKL